jgi:hypothetical protein
VWAETSPYVEAYPQVWVCPDVKVATFGAPSASRRFTATANSPLESGLLISASICNFCLLAMVSKVDVDSMGIAVNELYFNRTSNSGPGLDILFVHESRWNENGSAWRTEDPASKNTWTQRHDRQVCWPKHWLPQDLGDNIRALSVSYDDAALRI